MCDQQHQSGSHFGSAKTRLPPPHSHSCYNRHIYYYNENVNARLKYTIREMGKN